MIFIYITCKDKKEAEKIGLVLLKRKLAACFLVIPALSSFYPVRTPPTPVGGNKGVS